MDNPYGELNIVEGLLFWRNTIFIHFYGCTFQHFIKIHKIEKLIKIRCKT